MVVAFTTEMGKRQQQLGNKGESEIKRMKNSEKRKA
ncbi:hypothetical protein B878_18031 [Vibrio campbellii CAIM 519 = NBRC 15631 = ATCC 25920]|nr:hypothetical protein B878_18031 [Vibrio campbellii CAIM 519 = NBRC 15631 = ATCC 25920]